MVAAALEVKSSHPLASAIVSRYSGCITDKLLSEGSQIGLPEVSDFKTENSMGLQGKINDVNIAVGNIEFMKKLNIIVHLKALECLDDWSNKGFTVVFIAINGNVRIVVNSSVRPRKRQNHQINHLYLFFFIYFYLFLFFFTFENFYDIRRYLFFN